MIPRILEPEVMDTVEEAIDYDAMNHREVNRVFVDDFLAACSFPSGCLGTTATDARPLLHVLDVGTGTAQIPIELCRRPVACRVTAIDLASEMIKLARRNIKAAGLAGSIEAELIDAKRLPYADGTFDAVMSNSIIHHIPHPQDCLAEMVRVLRPGGTLFVRDLLRPDDQKTLELIVATYAGDANPHQQQMFGDSLHAALTVGEVRQMLEKQGLPPEAVRQTTDRHWTVRCTRLPSQFCES